MPGTTLVPGDMVINKEQFCLLAVHKQIGKEGNVINYLLNIAESAVIHEKEVGGGRDFLA